MFTVKGKYDEAKIFADNPDLYVLTLRVKNE